jgi:hypothetical protein
MIFSVTTDPSIWNKQYQYNKSIWLSQSTYLDHSQALLRCKLFNFDLLTLDTPEEVHDFENAFTNKGWLFEDYTHMGAHREYYSNQFIWSANSSPMYYGPRWAYSQPDNQDGTEQCVVLRKNYELHDHKCGMQLKFFCMAKAEKRKWWW